MAVFNQALTHCTIMSLVIVILPLAPYLVAFPSLSVMVQGSLMVYNSVNISVPHGEMLALPSGFPTHGLGIRLGRISRPMQTSCLLLPSCKLFVDFSKAYCFSSCCANLSKNIAL